MRRTQSGPVQWYGGKYHQAKIIIPHIPRSRIYAEAYGGTAHILVNLSPRPVEVYNDINGDLVNLFRAIQDPVRLEKLQRRLTFTLYSRAEFVLAIETLKTNKDPEARAWAMYVATNQGFNATGRTTPGNWSHTLSKRRPSAWVNKIANLPILHRRLQQVQIDCRDALEFITCWDSKDTTFYLDPPYITATRQSKNVYDFECDDDHHKQLVSLLLKIKGSAVLSGYEHSTYEPLTQAGWNTFKYIVPCRSTIRRNKPMQYREEKLWIKGSRRRGFNFFMEQI